MPDFGNLNELIRKAQPTALENAPGISPIAPGASPTGKIAPMTRKIPATAPKQAPNPYQTEFQKQKTLYDTQVQNFETYKSLQNPETAGDLTLNLMNKGLTPELQTWFNDTYKEDKEFASVMNKFHSNLLALQHNLPTDIDAAKESQTASQKIMDWVKKLFTPQTPPPAGTSLAEVRKKQGPGFYQADIGE